MSNKRHKERRCIYCSPDNPSVKEHNREHVIPEAFGKFINNLVLNQGVCKDCNDHFGKTIDRVLARGSALALKRFDHGLKGPNEISDLIKGNLEFELAINHEYDGMKLRLVNKDGEMKVEPLPQVGFQRESDQGWKFISQVDLEDMDYPLPEKILLEKQVFIIDSDEMEKDLIDACNKRGINCSPKISDKKISHIIEQEVNVEITAGIKQMELRGVAKILFNYLAKVFGIDFVTRKEFNTIREFIRYGNIPNHQIVTPLESPAARKMNVWVKPKIGHTIWVKWIVREGDLLGYICLLSFTMYKIFILKNYNGIIFPIHSGHFFNLDSRRIKKLKKF